MPKLGIHSCRCRGVTLNGARSRLARNAANPLRMDPTKTTGIRQRFMAEVRRRFGALRKHIIDFIDTKDAFGLRDRKSFITANIQPREYQFLTDPNKVKAFNDWFKMQVDADIFSVAPGTNPDEPWTAKYVESAYKRGQINSYIEAKRAEIIEAGGLWDTGQEAFLRSAFNVPETLSKVQLLGTRAWEGMKGVTSTMGSQMNIVMAQGMVDGLGARAMARELAGKVDGLMRSRAMTIARTEIIHAHAEGQLDAFRALGVEELGVKAEWSTAGDDRVCDECAALEGQVYDMDESSGLIPFHPNCRCAWIPSKAQKKPAGGKTVEDYVPPAPAEILEPEPTATIIPTIPMVPTMPPPVAPPGVAELFPDISEFTPAATREEMLKADAIRAARVQAEADAARLSQAAFEAGERERVAVAIAEDAEWELKVATRAARQASRKVKSAADKADPLAVNKEALEAVKSPAISKLEADATAISEKLGRWSNEAIDSWRTVEGAKDNAVKKVLANARPGPKNTDTLMGWAQGQAVHGPTRLKMEVATEFLQEVTDSNLLKGVKRSYVSIKKGRAKYQAGTITVSPSSNVGTVVHEFGHHLQMNRDLMREEVAFLRRRANVTSSSKLEHIYRRKKEVGFKGDFAAKGGDEYTGRIYGAYKDAQGEWQWSFGEVTSMGMQYLYDKPALFLEKDPDFFQWITGQIRGGKNAQFGAEADLRAAKSQKEIADKLIAEKEAKAAAARAAKEIAQKEATEAVRAASRATELALKM